jgi:membrane protein YdbS with pleckstrin-like domain
MKEEEGMQENVIYPNSRLMKKFFIIAALVYAIPCAVILVLFFFIMAKNGIGLAERPGVIFFIIFGAASAVTWILAAALIPPYFRSISYELTGREIIVRKGILTKVVQTVPYRTITNIVEARDIIDRYWVNLGSIRIQTAGMSGTAGYEASLNGLEAWETVNAMVQDRLRAFRGAMSADAADVEPRAGTDVLADMLEELRAIRSAVERKS